jgi:hypothetical protein
MKIIPVYINDGSVSSIMGKLSGDSSLSNASSRTIRETIEKRLKINNIYDIDPSEIVIRPGRGGYTVTLNYEPRGNLFGNLDYVISFKHEATIASHTAE